MRTRCWDRRLRRSGKFSSLILWGPPGSGKTTLARLIAARKGAEFIGLSAVLAGVKDVRAAIDEARKSQRRGKRTILFIDEIHRFNKAQQDALLGAVEDGTVTLIGATTENPSFEVNAALLSRCRVAVLESLPDQDIATILERALTDPDRGLASASPRVDPELIDKLAAGRRGDAPGRPLGSSRRPSPNALPAADGSRLVTEPALVEALGRARYAYDRQGEDHYNLASALIKSLRNSDASAALYWLARMILGGADPLFIAHAGCASWLPRTSAWLTRKRSCRRRPRRGSPHLIGFPEALFPLAQATIYLARAPKSNLVKNAYQAAAADATEQTAREPVPLHLRNAVTSLMKNVGYGQGYRYVHDDPAARAEMPCLPERLQGRDYFSGQSRSDGDE